MFEAGWITSILAINTPARVMQVQNYNFRILKCYSTEILMCTCMLMYTDVFYGKFFCNMWIYFTQIFLVRVQNSFQHAHTDRNMCTTAGLFFFWENDGEEYWDWIRGRVLNSLVWVAALRAEIERKLKHCLRWIMQFQGLSGNRATRFIAFIYRRRKLHAWGLNISVQSFQSCCATAVAG